MVHRRAPDRKNTSPLLKKSKEGHHNFIFDSCLNQDNFQFIPSPSSKKSSGSKFRKMAKDTKERLRNAYPSISIHSKQNLSVSQNYLDTPITNQSKMNSNSNSSRKSSRKGNSNKLGSIENFMNDENDENSNSKNYIQGNINNDNSGRGSSKDIGLNVSTVNNFQNISYSMADIQNRSYARRMSQKPKKLGKIEVSKKVQKNEIKVEFQILPQFVQIRILMLSKLMRWRLRNQRLFCKILKTRNDVLDIESFAIFMYLMVKSDKLRVELYALDNRKIPLILFVEGDRVEAYINNPEKILSDLIIDHESHTMRLRIWGEKEELAIMAQLLQSGSEEENSSEIM